MSSVQKVFKLIPEYHKTIPEHLFEGVLYISEEYKSAIHLCACGCKGKVVTPLDSWKLTKNNNDPFNVTLRPSIGNWKGETPYHAHYYITNNKIQWL